MRIFSRKNTFANIIISYLIVLVIPLIFGVSFFVTTLGITRRSVDEANLSVQGRLYAPRLQYDGPITEYPFYLPGFQRLY